MYILTDGDWGNTFLYKENGNLVLNIYAIKIHALNKKMATIKTFTPTKGIIPFGILCTVFVTIYDSTYDKVVKRIYRNVDIYKLEE